MSGLCDNCGNNLGTYEDKLYCKYDAVPVEGSCIYYTLTEMSKAYKEGMALAIKYEVPNCMLELIVTDDIVDTECNINRFFSAVREIINKDKQQITLADDVIAQYFKQDNTGYDMKKSEGE
jgi:hypothetical protein